MKKILSLVIGVLFNQSVYAMATDGYYKITKLWTWADYTGGVVLIQLDKVNSLCPNGYWIKASRDSSSVNVFSVALSAYHAQTPVKIYANENSDWSGLSAKECEIQLIALDQEFSN